jgi:hypothetical protein
MSILATAQRRITSADIIAAARKQRIEPAAARAVLEVEANGRGFSAVTGRILIQFEPAWFQRLLPASVMLSINLALKARQIGKVLSTEEQKLLLNWTLVSTNRVQDQTAEYKAFNAAFAIHGVTALKATSWGLGQLMGFHFQRLGFATVGEMVDYCKQGEAQQFELTLRFVVTDPKLFAALNKHDWNAFAYRYNGSRYKNDPRIREDDYDYKLAVAYAKFKALPAWN